MESCLRKDPEGKSGVAKGRGCDATGEFQALFEKKILEQRKEEKKRGESRERNGNCLKKDVTVLFLWRLFNFMSKRSGELR